MYCRICGASLPEDSIFCSHCGTRLDAGYASPAPAENIAAAPGYDQPSAPGGKAPGMGWFKFIVNVQLICCAVAGIINGIYFFSGTQYGDAADAVYSSFPAVKSIDLFYSAAMLGTGIFALYTRRALAAYRSDGPKMFFIFCGISMALPMLYSVAINIFTGIGLPDLIDVSQASAFVMALALLLVNISYLGKRKHLFIH